MRPVNVIQSADSTRYEFYDHDATPEDFDDRLIVSKNKYEDHWLAGGFGYKGEIWTIGDKFDLQWLVARAKEFSFVHDLVALLGESDDSKDERANMMSELSERTAEYVRNNSSVFGSK